MSSTGNQIYWALTGVLSITVTSTMNMLLAVSASYVAQYLTSLVSQGTVSTEGLNSLALQQGGIGLILTTLIISAPPMAATFFQGTLGQLQTYSPFGHVGADSVAQGGAATRQQTPLFGHSGGSTPPSNSGQGNSSSSSSGGGNQLNSTALTTAYGVQQSPQATGQSLS